MAAEIGASTIWTTVCHASIGWWAAEFVGRNAVGNWAITGARPPARIDP